MLHHIAGVSGRDFELRKLLFDVVGLMINSDRDSQTAHAGTLDAKTPQLERSQSCRPNRAAQDRTQQNRPRNSDGKQGRGLHGLILLSKFLPLLPRKFQSFLVCIGPLLARCLKGP